MNKENGLEAIVLLLVVFLFQDGVYKLAHWSGYEFWLKGAPYLHYYPRVWKFAIPGFDIVVSVGLLIRKYRFSAMIAGITGISLAIVQVLMSLFFSSHLFFPFHLLWFRPIWFAVLLSYIAFLWLIYGAMQLRARLSK